MRLLLLLLLLLSGQSVIGALSHTPAFDPQARQATVTGDWRVAVTTAMYDRGEYAFQRGYGFLAADALILAETEARDRLATPQTAQSRAERALSALQEAVSLDPGNAHAWVAQGWAYARLADDTRALDRLRISWALAPYNRVLAENRINLLGALTQPEMAIVALADADLAALEKDRETLERWDPAALAFYAELYPHLVSRDLR